MDHEQAEPTTQPAAPEPMATPRRRIVRQRATVIQTKLVVGAAGDPLEREADAIADLVVRRLSRGSGGAIGPAPAIEDHSPRIRRAVSASGGDVDPDVDAEIRSSAGRGRPLDGSVRRRMEDGFGADFSSVRVHADAAASRLNDRVSARAFTTGRDVYFGAGAYRPGTTSGEHLLAHELAHVVQQGGATIRRTPDGGGGNDGEISESRVSDGSRITLRQGRGAVGSVTVSPTGGAAAEATDLSVNQSNRGQGHGAELLAAAARTAEAAGRSRLTLGSQDDGSGSLDRWYRSLGFRDAGEGDGGFTRFEAPTRVLRSTVVRRSPVVRTTGSSRVLMRMQKTVVWWEKVGDNIEPRYEKKPGGYRMVKGLKADDGKPVFETQEQRSTHVKPSESYAEKIAKLGLPPEDDADTVFEMDPALIRFSQDSISSRFTDESKIEDLKATLIRTPAKAKELPPIRVLMGGADRLVTLDNRRLWCCKEAMVPIRCRWATPKEIKNDGFKFTADARGEGRNDIKVRA